MTYPTMKSASTSFLGEPIYLSQVLGGLVAESALRSVTTNINRSNAGSSDRKPVLRIALTPVSIGDVSATGQEALPDVLKRTLPWRFAANGHYYTDVPLSVEHNAKRRSYDLGTQGPAAKRKLATLMNDPAAGLNFVFVGGRIRKNDFGLGELASREPRPRLSAEEWRNKILTSVDGLPPVIKDFAGMFLGAGLKLGGELVFTAEALGELLAPLIGRLTKDDASWAQFINSNFAGNDPANTALRKLFTLGGRPVAEGADPKFLTAVMLVALKRGGAWAADTTPAQAAAGLGQGIKSLLKDELKTLDPSRYPPEAMGGYIGTVLGSLATFWLPAARLGLGGLSLLAGGAKLAKQLAPGMLKASGKKLQLAANQLAELGALKKAGKLSLPEGRRREALMQAVQKAAQAAEAGDAVGFSKALREVEVALHAAKAPASTKVVASTKAAGAGGGASAGESAAARHVHGQPPPNEIKQVVQQLDDARDAFKRAPSAATHNALKQAWRDVVSLKSDARWANKDAKKLFLLIVKNKHDGVAVQNAVAKPWKRASPPAGTPKDPLSGVTLGDEFFNDGKASVGSNGKSGKRGGAQQKNNPPPIEETPESMVGKKEFTPDGRPVPEFKPWAEPPLSTRETEIPFVPPPGTITKAAQALAPELSQLLRQTEVILRPGDQLLFEVKRLKEALKAKGPLSVRDIAALNQLQWRASVQSTVGELNKVLGSPAGSGSGDWRKRVNDLTAKLKSLARQGAQAGWGKDVSQLIRYLAPNGALQGQIKTKERLNGRPVEQGVNNMVGGAPNPEAVDAYAQRRVGSVGSKALFKSLSATKQSAAFSEKVLNADLSVLQELTQQEVESLQAHLAKLPRQGAGNTLSPDAAQAKALLDTLALKRPILSCISFDFSKLPGGIGGSTEAGKLNTQKAARGFAIRLLAAGQSPQKIAYALGTIFGGGEQSMYSQTMSQLRSDGIKVVPDNQKAFDEFVIGELAQYVNSTTTTSKKGAQTYRGTPEQLALWQQNFARSVTAVLGDPKNSELRGATAEERTQEGLRQFVATTLKTNAPKPNWTQLLWRLLHDPNLKKYSIPIKDDDGRVPPNYVPAPNPLGTKPINPLAFTARWNNIFQSETATRIVIPVNVTQLPSYRLTQAVLSANGYSITDWDNGLATHRDAPDRPVKVAVLLKDLASGQRDKKLFPTASDENFGTKFPNETLKKLENAWGDRLTSASVVVLSRDPQDIARASTGRHWSSCVALDPVRVGSNAYTLPSAMKEGVLVAYVTTANDPHLQRVRSRAIANTFDRRQSTTRYPSVNATKFQTGDTLIAPPPDVAYGTANKDLPYVLAEALAPHNEKLPSGEYALRGAQYGDEEFATHINQESVKKAVDEIRGLDGLSAEARRVALAFILRRHPADIKAPEVKQQLSASYPNGLDLQGANLDGVELANIDLRNADLRSASFVGTDLSYADLSGAKLSDANFRNANLTRATLNTVTAEDCSFSHANLTFTKFNHAQLQRAYFAGADTTYTSFNDANLEFANFELARLRGTRFYDTNLRGANFDYANLNDVDFSTAYLRDVSVSGVTAHNTTWPDGFVAH